MAALLRHINCRNYYYYLLLLGGLGRRSPKIRGGSTSHASVPQYCVSKYEKTKKGLFWKSERDAFCQEKVHIHVHVCYIYSTVEKGRRQTKDGWWPNKKGHQKFSALIWNLFPKKIIIRKFGPRISLPPTPWKDVTLCSSGLGHVFHRAEIDWPSI